VGDREVFDELYPLVREIMESANKHLDSDGILTVPENDMFIDWCAGLQKQTAHFGVYLYTLDNLVNTLEAMGSSDAEIYRARLEEGRRVAKNTLYNEEKGAFVNARDEWQYSVHSNAWMVLGGVVEGEKAKKILLDSLNSNDSMKPLTPYMYHYVIEALFKLNLVKEATYYLKKYLNLN
jgi:hypothetical protein